MEKCLNPGLEQEEYKMNLEYHMEPENKSSKKVGEQGKGEWGVDTQ